MPIALHVVGPKDGPVCIASGPPDRRKVAKMYGKDVYAPPGVYEIAVIPMSHADVAQVALLLTLTEIRQRTLGARQGKWRHIDHQRATEILAEAAAAAENPAQPVLGSYAAAVAAFREAVGLSRAGLAHMIGVNRTSIIRLETGEMSLSFEVYARLRLWARKLGLLEIFEQAFNLDGHAPGAPSSSTQPGQGA